MFDARGVDPRIRWKNQTAVKHTHILNHNKAKRGIRFVTFKRQVPQSRGLDASNAEFVPNTHEHKSKIQSTNPCNHLVKLSIRAHDSLTASHVALSE
jgi:hypothetical protein